MTSLLDLILVIVAVEAVIVIAQRYLRGRTHELPFDLANLASGVCLLLGVRFALVSAPTFVIVLLVTAAGAAHAVDAFHRFR